MLSRLLRRDGVVSDCGLASSSSSSKGHNPNLDLNSKLHLETGPPPLSKGLNDHPPPPPHPLSEGLDPALIKQRRRRRQRERQKCNRLSQRNNNFARASCFFVHFFTVTPRLRRGNAYFDGLWRT